MFQGQASKHVHNNGVESWAALKASSLGIKLMGCKICDTIIAKTDAHHPML